MFWATEEDHIKCCALVLPLLQVQMALLSNINISDNCCGANPSSGSLCYTAAPCATHEAKLM